MSSLRERYAPSQSNIQNQNLFYATGTTIYGASNRATFLNSARTAEDLIVFIFDVGGNKYRVVCGINFASSLAFIKLILTHDDYTRWNRLGRPL